MKKVRIGIVGTGFASRFHVECLRRVYGSQVEIAGVTSLRKQSRESFGAKYGIKAYQNAESMLNDIDVLDISRYGIMIAFENNEYVVFVPAEIKTHSYLKKLIKQRHVSSVSAFKAVTIR